MASIASSGTPGGALLELGLGPAVSPFVGGVALGSVSFVSTKWLASGSGIVSWT